MGHLRRRRRLRLRGHGSNQKPGEAYEAVDDQLQAWKNAEREMALYSKQLDERQAAQLVREQMSALAALAAPILAANIGKGLNSTALMSSLQGIEAQRSLKIRLKDSWRFSTRRAKGGWTTSKGSSSTSSTTWKSTIWPGLPASQTSQTRYCDLYRRISVSTG